MARFLFELGWIYYDMGYAKKAIGYFQQVYSIFDEIYGDEHPHTKTVKEWLDGLKGSRVEFANSTKGL